MNDFTPEQKKQLSTWASQRDSILIDIGNKKTESEKLTENNKTLADSNTEISTKIERSKGRLEELEKHEMNRAKFIPQENAILILEKTKLQTEIFNLKSEITTLIDTKKKIIEDIEMLKNVHGTVFNNTNNLEKTITNIVSVCSGNAQLVADILESVEARCRQILTLSSLNIEAHNNVLNEIPKLFVELRKKSLQREVLVKHK